MKPRVLCACESSGTCREAFIRKGCDAWSCDLLPADDGSQFHYQGDCLEIMKQGWDLILAFPPCTHLAVSGARHFAAKRADGRQQQGIDFFMAVVNSCKENSKHWAVENPIGIMSSLFRKPDQIIQPWMFGHGETKATCLWLGGLTKLEPSCIVSGREQKVWKMPPSAERWKLRSKTFDGIANAMADQWYPLIVQKTE